MSQTTPTPDQFPFIHEVEVRFRDLDGMGHVNNAVYATYFETARIRYMSELARLRQEQADSPSEQSFILLDLYCRFVDQVSYGERLQVGLRVSEIGNTSFKIEYLVSSLENGRVVATGYTTQVWFDYVTGEKLPVPESFRRIVAPDHSSDGADA
jgi:acyl-CoA thioester hydrolase